MIRMSRFLAVRRRTRRDRGSAGCSQTCGLVGCLQGVGSPSRVRPRSLRGPDRPCDSTSGAPNVTCTLMLGDGAGPLACPQAKAFSENGNQVRSPTPPLDRIQVTVSSNGAQVTQQTFNVH